MVDLIPFQFDTHSVDVRIDEAGNPWWVLKDICAALGIADASMAADRLKPSESMLTTISGTFHSELKLLLVNEQGLYRLIMRSNKPEAERFQDWVFGEVLPQIRKTGKYETQPPKILTPAEMFLEQAKVNVVFEREILALASTQAAQQTQLDTQAATLAAIQDRQPLAGKLRPGDWLRRFSKPRLNDELMRQLNAACRRGERAEDWRPEGYDFAVPYHTPQAIEHAYEEVTKQLSFIHEPGVPYQRQQRGR